MGSGQFRGSSPTPVIPLSYAADGHTLTPVSATAPLPTTPGLPSSATQSTVSVTNSSQVLKDAVTGLKGLVMTNNGANDAYWSLSGTAVSGATAVLNGGHRLQPGQTVALMDIGPLVVAAISPSGTVLALSPIS